MKRNKFSLSNYKLLTCDMGQLIPVNVTEVLPGDSIQQATSLLLRVSPLMAPVMHPVQVRIHHWFVPYRQIWEDFEKFITGGKDNDDNSVPPYQTGAIADGSISDYLGMPSGYTGNFSVLPHRAYNLICNEFYMDQDLSDPAPIGLESGSDSNDYSAIRNCCWEKDYFTSARPWTQKGDDVSISIGDEADITGSVPAHDHAMSTNIYSLTGSPNGVFADAVANPIAPVQGPAVDMSGILHADLSTATAVTINQLREAFALQRYAEARAKYGSRYTEYLRYLGVNSSDGRLNRPEYLGGGKQTIQFSEVLQTGGTSTGAQTGVGNLAGHGISAMRTNRYRRFFEEHGLIMSILSVRPKTIYCQGLSKMWSRQTKEDFYQRELEGIGQQAILNKEIYAEHSSPEAEFGFQDRYDEYRRQESMIHGEFRGDLSHWHMARIFAGDVTLNEDFVKCDPTKRIHAIQNKNTLWIMANNSIQARRMIGGNR